MFYTLIKEKNFLVLFLISTLSGYAKNLSKRKEQEN
jgi:hypothetical protein